MPTASGRRTDDADSCLERFLACCDSDMHVMYSSAYVTRCLPAGSACRRRTRARSWSAAWPPSSKWWTSSACATRACPSPRPRPRHTSAPPHDTAYTTPLLLFVPLLLHFHYDGGRIAAATLNDIIVLGADASVCTPRMIHSVRIHSRAILDSIRRAASETALHLNYVTGAMPGPCYGNVMFPCVVSNAIDECYRAP